jgi:LPXTG-motif cell wall-anchored protein
MRRLILGSFLAAALVPAATAWGGGWATAGVGPPPDGGISPGEIWNAEVTILQHGVTPLVGVSPTLTIRNDSGKAITFPAKPTKKPGVYVAAVKFPSAGKWRYEIYDGFGTYGGAKTHTFGPITVGGDTGGSSFPVLPSLGGAALALLAGVALLFLIRRQRRPEPVPA